MHHTRFVSALLAVLLLAALFMTGCSAKDPGPEATAPETTAPTAPVAPADPTDPPEPTPHQVLAEYLKKRGAVKVEEKTYTFTMSVDGEKILWTYSNESTNITVTLVDGADKHPVAIKFATYDATAEIDVAAYSGVTPQLSNFHCWDSQAAASLASMATSVVSTCFTQAAKAMEPSGVNLVSLGFTNYYS